MYRATPFLSVAHGKGHSNKKSGVFFHAKPVKFQINSQFFGLLAHAEPFPARQRHDELRARALGVRADGLRALRLPADAVHLAALCGGERLCRRHCRPRAEKAPAPPGGWGGLSLHGVRGRPAGDGEAGGRPRLRGQRAHGPDERAAVARVRRGQRPARPQGEDLPHERPAVHLRLGRGRCGAHAGGLPALGAGHGRGAGRGPCRVCGGGPGAAPLCAHSGAGMRSARRGDAQRVPACGPARGFRLPAQRPRGADADPVHLRAEFFLARTFSRP